MRKSRDQAALATCPGQTAVQCAATTVGTAHSGVASCRKLRDSSQYAANRGRSLRSMQRIARAPIHSFRRANPNGTAAILPRGRNECGEGSGGNSLDGERGAAREKKSSFAGLNRSEGSREVKTDLERDNLPALEDRPNSRHLIAMAREQRKERVGKRTVSRISTR